MAATNPTKPGCYQAHYPNEHRVEIKCLPPVRAPNPRHVGSNPNTAGASTDRFATMTAATSAEYRVDRQCLGCRPARWAPSPAIIQSFIRTPACK